MAERHLRLATAAFRPTLKQQQRRHPPEPEDDLVLTTQKSLIISLALLIACAMVFFGAEWFTQPDTEVLHQILSK